MVYIGGGDRRTLDELARALSAAGHPVAVLTAADLEPGELFTRLQAGATDLVHVEPLPRLAERVDPLEPLAPLARAVAAAGAARLVLVTGRAPDDPELAALRRSGASYVILQVERLIDLPEEAVARLRGTRRIVVPPALAARAAGAPLLSDLCRAVVEAVASDSCGSTRVIAPADGDDALRSHLLRIGARPARSRVGAAFCRVTGAPSLTIGPAGALVCSG
ncbi:MAG TPA: hypothetical protein VFU21_25550 [Kofleriaceae bacterium]|nr:hypothetical protein [Kofleriaceae bacterium]